jgi:hypothetical protein
MIKRYLYLLLAVMLTVASCKTKKDTFVLSPEEFEKFSTRGYEVLYEGKPVASFEILELEYFKGELIKEYSLEQYSPYPTELSEKILRYMHMRYPDAKIEVKFQKENRNQKE